MDSSEFSQIRPVLDLVEQPIFLIEYGQVSYRNAAAKALVELGPFLQPLPLPASEDPEQAVQFTAKLGYRDYSITAMFRYGGVLCLVEQKRKDLMRPDKELRLLSRSIQKPLDSLTQTVNTLLPRWLGYVAPADKNFQMPTDEEIRHKVSSIYENLYRLQRMALWLLDPDDLVMGDGEIHIHPEEMRAYFHRLAASVSDLLRYVDLKLEFIGLKELTWAPVDSELLERAIWNLIANAATNCHSGDTLVLEVSREDGYLVVCVTAPDADFSVSERAPAYEQFWMQPPEEQPLRGIGFGLLAARRVAELHHGTAMYYRSGGKSKVSLTLQLPKIIRSAPNEELTISQPERNSRISRSDWGLLSMAELLPTVAFLPKVYSQKRKKRHPNRKKKQP